MEAWTLLALMAGFFAGSLLQRTAGMGLSLVAAPVLSLLLGPVAGIGVTNVGTVVSSTVVLSQVWRRVDWGRYLRIASVFVLGSVPGAFLVREVGTAWLDVLVGASVLLGLGVTWVVRHGPPLHGTVPAVLAGVAGGFMNTTAGVAGPAMAVYGLASRWEHSSFTATLQPIFLTAGLISFVTKSLTGAFDPTQLVPWWVWAAVVVAILCGVATGTRLSGRLDPRAARALTLAVAITGSVVTLVRGLLTL